MAHITGIGTMGQAISGLVAKGGNTVELLNSPLEALAFLQITLAAGEKTTWADGFAVTN